MKFFIDRLLKIVIGIGASIIKEKIFLRLSFNLCHPKRRERRIFIYLSFSFTWDHWILEGDHEIEVECEKQKKIYNID